MLSPEAERFLHEHTRTFLLTLRPDGGPTCHPMVAFYRDGALYMTTYRKSAKVRNLTRDARVACVVMAPDDAPGMRAVVLRGRAEVVPAEAMRGAASSRRVTGAADIASVVQARLAEGKRVVVRVVPDEARLIGD